MKVLGVDQNPTSCYNMTASNGYTRRYHPTQGADLETALKMWDQLSEKTGVKLYERQKMSYILEEIRGEYLKSIAKEISISDFKAQYTKFNAADSLKCLMNEESAGIFYCESIKDSLMNFSISQGSELIYNQSARVLNKNQVELSDGQVLDSKAIVLCTNGEGYYDKFNLQPAELKSAIIDLDSSALPELYTDMTKDGFGFYGQVTGDGLKSYVIGMTDFKTDDQIQEYLDMRIPGAKIREIHFYIDLRRDNKLVTVCEKGKDDGLYYLFSPPYRLAPLYALEILNIIEKDKQLNKL
ncbi:UNKNOWN [Stylonychia lemnae]|uniref:FAD dependent oxidoreductase domain-containing protein n=1 Tax=Stylonychia lemnae TaxID=5949 RepID=A0A078BDP0_STYLE|nr:UNKNOWN [Stylonychia lemnae]|eukprot:CDW91297.1 UNKNOWN [Stylonychia lemnae]